MATPWKTLRDAKLSKKGQQARVTARVEKELLEMDLRAIRELAGKTQEDLAEALEQSQGVISRMESRHDHKLSTLRRYVVALGGELEVRAIIGDKTVKLYTS